MTSFKEWLHHLIDPHCIECNEKKECKSCQILHEQLDLSNREKMKLLDTIIDLNRKEIPVEAGPVKEFQPINKNIPWYRERARLEEESRREAERLRVSKQNDISNDDVKALEDLVLGEEGKLQ